jgi:hypothetical protein
MEPRLEAKSSCRRTVKTRRPHARELAGDGQTEPGAAKESALGGINLHHPRILAQQVLAHEQSERAIVVGRGRARP